MAEIHKLSVEKTLNKIRPTMQSNLERQPSMVSIR